MRIDSHQHFWLMKNRVGQWPGPDLAPIYRDFLPLDIIPNLQQCHVDATVVVQSLPSIEDTYFLLELADQNNFIKGVVGWIDLLSPTAAENISQLAQHPKFKGLRPMLQDIESTDWISNPALEPGIRAMIQHSLVFDGLVQPRHLPALYDFAIRFPELPIVIDHAAKPLIASGILEPWKTDISAFHSLKNVHCKLSGMLTEAGPNADMSKLAPYVEHLFEVFGSSRLIWGSDWPVLELAASYSNWLTMANQLCEKFGANREEIITAIFGGNAQRFYSLNLID